MQSYDYWVLNLVVMLLCIFILYINYLYFGMGKYPKCDAAFVFKVLNQGLHYLDQGTSESVIRILHIT